jgi:Family of unknown function (DUF5407)
MRKLVALITLSTVAGLGAALTTAGAAGAALTTASAAGAEDPSAASSSPGAGVLFNESHAGTRDVTTKIDALAGQRPVASVGDMFEMAMTMNHLAQVQDMSTSVVSASNTSVVAMARGTKA